MSEVFPESPPSPPPATGTPGQAFRATLIDRWTARNRCVDGRTWDQLPAEDRADMEAAARAAIDAQPPSAAPELAAAMAETRQVRDGYQGLCDYFGPSPQSGMSARISLTMLNRHRERAGLPPLRPREAQGKPDPLMHALDQLAEVRRIAYQGGQNGESVRSELLAYLEANGGING